MHSNSLCPSKECCCNGLWRHGCRFSVAPPRLSAETTPSSSRLDPATMALTTRVHKQCQHDLNFYENFFSQEESSVFLKALSQEIQWKQKSIRIFGKNILEPRLTAWYGDPHAVYAYSGVSMAPYPWIPILIKIKSRVENACEANFNSVLLNLYRDHRDSMGMHSDDEKELGAQPIIASVSLGETRRFVLKHRIQKNNPSKTYWLHSGSLIIMRGDTQKSWKHGIPKESQFCGPRINLTFRNILKPSEKNRLRHSPAKV